MSFEKTVKSVPAIAPSLRNGLQAMGANSRLVRPTDPRGCEGSIDLDDCYSKLQPQASRWDYAIGYKGKSYFVEVHPANGQVTEIIAKCTWLRSWLKEEGAPLAQIHGDGAFHWLSTAGVNIFSNGKARLAQNKIIVNSLRLS